MRITDEAVIKDGEKELIDSIIGDLDWTAIEDIFKEKHQLDIQDDVEYRQGDIVVHDNDVAYKLDFDVKVTLSILFDRSGNSVSIETSGDLTKEPSPTTEDDTVAGEIDDTSPPEPLEEAADKETIEDAAAEETSISDTPEDSQDINEDVAESSNDTADEMTAPSEEEDIPPLVDEVAEDITADATENLEQLAEEDPVEGADGEEAELTEAAMEAPSEVDDVPDSQADEPDAIQDIGEEVTEPSLEAEEETETKFEGSLILIVQRFNRLFDTIE